MLSGSALVSALGTAVVTRPKTGLWYRATPLAHAEDPLGRGRPIRWMRFNEEKGARVLYLGETPQICMEEVNAIGYPAPYLRGRLQRSPATHPRPRAPRPSGISSRFRERSVT